MPNFRQHAVLRQPFIGPIEFGLRNPQFAGLFPQPRMPECQNAIIQRNTFYPTQQRMPAAQPRMPGGLGMRQRGMRLPQRQLSNYRMPAHVSPEIIDLRSEEGGSQSEVPASEEASLEALEDLEGGSLLDLQE